MTVHVTDVSTWGLYSMLATCFGCCGSLHDPNKYILYTVYIQYKGRSLYSTIVPVAGVGTWVWYIKCIICMLQVSK